MGATVTLDEHTDEQESRRVRLLLFSLVSERIKRNGLILEPGFYRLQNPGPRVFLLSVVVDEGLSRNFGFIQDTQVKVT